MENYRSFSLYNYSTHDNILTLQRCGSKNSTDTINTFDNIPKMVVKKVLTDEAGNNFEKYYDAVGNLRREIKYVEGIPSDNPERVLIPLITDYKYDDLYRVIEVKTPNDKHIYYTYDGLGRQSSRTTPDAGEVKYKYDKNDNLRFSQDNNQANKFTERPPARYITYRGYDGLNRLLYVCDSYNESYLPLWNSLNPDITYNFENYDIAIIRNNFLVINVYDTLANYPANANIFSERLPADYYSSAPRNTNNTKGTLCATAYRTLGTDEWSFKYYRYDARGRVIKMWNYIAGLGEKSIEYSYNSQNQITDMRYENEEPESKKFRYAYDYAGRLLNTSFDYIPSDSPIDDYLIFSSYTYDQNSQISTSKFNPINLTYTSEYDSRSRITRFTCSKPNIFSYSLTYYANSNIQSQSFSGDYKYYFSNQYDLSVNYSYDNSNRLLNANFTHTEDNTFDLINSYDPDGNILSLQRFGSNNNLIDNYNYAYYAGTNRLRIVSGSTNQFTYDYNGNMTNDYMNNNTGIKYDHRNLITEITKQNLNQDPPTTYITRYRYDEAGNRTRKTIFLSNEYDPPPLPEEDTDLPPGWIIIVDDYYSRDVAGREIMVYSSYTPLYWNVWSGGEITGRINCGNGTRNYYLKDHLGSVRVVIDDGRTVVSANDYDMWGYYLENRTYESFNTKNKFTGKERDNESTYDYFGARYYDARVGRWGQVEPLLDKYISFSSYQYGLLNPMRLIDANGKDVYIFGPDAINTVKAINESTNSNFFVSIDPSTGKLEFEGTAESPQEMMLVNAIINEKINVNLTTTLENYIEGEPFAVGSYYGNRMEEGKLNTDQIFNINHSKIWEDAGGSSIGKSALHEIIESYYGALLYPNEYGYKEKNFKEAHRKTVDLETPKEFYPEIRNFQIKLGKNISIHSKTTLFNKSRNKEYLLFENEKAREYKKQ